MLRRIFRFCVGGALAFAMVAIAAWIIVAHSAGDRIADNISAVRPATAALVPGTSRRVRSGASNPYFANRIEAAAELWRAGKIEYIIVSGNQARGGYDEPRDMRDALVAKGVPAAKIYRDYAGFRTLDSVLRAREIFGQDRVIVVSQRFQIERALFLAQSHGILFDGFEAADVALPRGLQTRAREVLARMWAIVDLVVDRRAKFGGTAVVLGKDAPT